MAIRDIFNYIAQHRGEVLDEKIRESLRKKGYPEEEIDEAFLMAENVTDLPKAATGRGVDVKVAPLPRRPTLWGAVVRGQEEKGEKTGEDSKAFVDIGAKNKRRYGWEFITGFLIPGGVYLLGLVISVFVELLFFIPDVTQIVSLGASIVISFSFYIWLRKSETGFSRGLMYGILILAAVLVYTITKDYFWK